MWRAERAIPLVLLALLALGQGASGDRIDGTWDGFQRERGTPLDGAKDALENAPPPALQGVFWRNSPGPVELADLVGSVVVVQFWDASSPAGRRGALELDALARAHAERGLVVVGVHPRVGLETLRAFLRKNPLGHPLCVDAGSTQSDWCADGYPDHFLVDRLGTLRMADLADADLEDAIELLLDEPGPPEG